MGKRGADNRLDRNKSLNYCVVCQAGGQKKKESNIDAEAAASVHSTELTPLLNLGHHLFILLPVFLCLLSWLGRQVTAHANANTHTHTRLATMCSCITHAEQSWSV